MILQPAQMKGRSIEVGLTKLPVKLIFRFVLQEALKVLKMQKRYLTMGQTRFLLTPQLSKDLN